MICEKPTLSVWIKVNKTQWLISKSLTILWNTLYNFESCFLVIDLFIQRKAKSLLWPDYLTKFTVHTVVPPGGRTGYCFAIHYVALTLTKSNLCVCVPARYVRLRVMNTVYLRMVREYLHFRYNDGIVVVFRKNLAKIYMLKHRNYMAWIRSYKIVAKLKKRVCTTFFIGGLKLNWLENAEHSNRSCEHIET